MSRQEPPLTIAQTCERLNQSRDSITSLCRQGEFPGAYKIGAQGKTSSWRIPAKAIERYETLRARSAAA